MAEIDHTKPDTEDETSPYELALAMHERAAGFAFLLRTAAEHFVSVSDSELAGVARLAEDIAAKAAELLEATRAKSLDGRGE
jgi:hypothetical protein